MIFDHTNATSHMAQFLDDADRSALARVNRSLADNNLLFGALYVDTFGEQISAGNSSRPSRRRNSARVTYFKGLRDVAKKWWFLLSALSKRDYPAVKLRELLVLWKFPCPHANGEIRISNYHRQQLNRAHPAFEYSPLLCVAARFQRWKAVQALLQEPYKADPTVTDVAGMNVLSSAAWGGNVSMVRYLLDSCGPEHLMQMTRAKGTPHMTSACGGKGPFTAWEWAQRKSHVCGEPFGKIARLLKHWAADNVSGAGVVGVVVGSGEENEEKKEEENAGAATLASTQRGDEDALPVREHTTRSSSSSTQQQQQQEKQASEPTLILRIVARKKTQNASHQGAEEVKK
jgi:hypothetical protein